MFGRNKNNNDGPSKSFLTVGPVLHYSHSNVHRWWWASIGVYLLACLFWSKITTGNLNSLQLQSVSNADIWSLGYFVVNPVSIFEYPWQILVLGLLMAILGFAPILLSQLLSSRYSVLPILMTAFIAKLPIMAFFLAISCVAVACRPLRFRSRFISIVLCSSPLIIYWGIFGGYVDVDPVKWGLSYAPWLMAWISGLAICALVLAIGHYTRYKPGATSVIALTTLLIAGFTFFYFISFAESDYQIYVVSNNPEESEEFHSRSVSAIIDKAVSEPLLDKDIFMMLSSVHEGMVEQKDAVRASLLEELEAMVNINVWPLWFMEQADSKFYDFKNKRNKRIEQLDYFIHHHPNSKRMPTALYYKALLREYLPDPKSLRRKEILEYYHDYPRPEVFPDWVRLYRDYPQSPESLEARWRIAVNLCRKGDFQTALSICREAIKIGQRLHDTLPTETTAETAIFTTPQETTVSSRKLDEIILKIKHLIEFIENNNIPENRVYKLRLAEYMRLNKHSSEYKERLDILLSKSPKTDPLRYNIELELILENTNPSERSLLLKKFIESNKKDDSLVHAYYELGLANVELWRETSEDSPKRDEYLNEARNILKKITETYPESVFKTKATGILNGLPRQEQPATNN